MVFLDLYASELKNFVNTGDDDRKHWHNIDNSFYKLMCVYVC